MKKKRGRKLVKNVMIMFESVREALNDVKLALDVVVPGRLVDYAAKKTKEKAL